jgi:PAS domain S-box-containing protein
MLERDSTEGVSRRPSLRQRAEPPVIATQAEAASMSPEEVQGLVHALQVRQIELERQAEDLARAQQDWERTFDAVPDLIAILDLQHRVVRANRAMAQRLGAEPHACAGLACYHCVHGRDAPPDGCPHALLLADGREHIAEVHEDRLGGDFLVSCTPLTDRRGRLVGSVHVARDITERKRAEEALQRAAEELKRSNQDLEHFAYMASHDLQEPVRVISGMLQLLERRCGPQLDEKAREFIAFAVDGAGRMANMIRDLLAYSRVDRKPKATEPADVDAALAAALADLAATVREAGATITHDPLPRLVADGRQLEQLFQNLLGNAVKFRKAGQPCAIHVGAERREKGWTIFVRDNGIGIAPEQHVRIFEIFQRLYSQEKYSGTGIGLAICKRIVERHGGRIWVESQPNEGATFCFTVPENAAAGGNPRECP